MADPAPEAVAAMVTRLNREAVHHEEADRAYTASEFRDAAAMLSQVATRAEKAERERDEALVEIEALKHDIERALDGLSAEAAALDAASRQLAAARALADWVWANCKVIYFPDLPSYPIEHNPHANKDMREAIEARALLSGETQNG